MFYIPLNNAPLYFFVKLCNLENVQDSFISLPENNHMEAIRMIAKFEIFLQLIFIPNFQFLFILSVFMRLFSHLYV